MKALIAFAGLILAQSSAPTTGQCAVLKGYCLELNYTTATVPTCINAYTLKQKTELLAQHDPLMSRTALMRNTLQN